LWFFGLSGCGVANACTPLYVVGSLRRLLTVSFPALEEEQRAKAERELQELHSFWKDYPLLVMAAPEGSRLHDLACDEIMVKDSSIPDGLEDDKDGEKKVC